ncbi:MAG: AfsR/SARP family transcriptional regulator [Microbacterium sp.]|uniref:AfsR/SARP family transcriptional regulator n=1 Tax=Microbacterium sp. TaxID=51671 RepID=UPI003F995412
MAGLEIRLLGPLEVVLDDRPVELPGQRARTLLVLLALGGGRIVTFERLAAGMWDDTPPVNVRGSLQTYVGRLRRVLGDKVIETGPSGYRLSIPPVSVDAVEFRRLVEAGEECTVPSDQRQLLHAALSLWPDGPTGEALTEWLRRYESPGLVERYLWAFERRIDLDLATDRHPALVSELRTLTDRFPLRETLWARLLRALQASGRRAEALDRYETLRVLLASELGIAPSTEVQAIHQSLLREPLRVGDHDGETASER